MPDTVICPSCGQANPADAASCAGCNYPLVEPLAAPANAPPLPRVVLAPKRAPAERPAPVTPVLRRPVRRVRPQPAMTSQQLALWLLFGVFGAGILIYTAIKANMDRSRPPVEGTNAEQQKQMDEIRDVVDRDSNNVQARVALGNLYYDTANWSDAIVQYRAAVRRDSTLVHALVDLGVCYYNLGNSVEAEHHFLLGLKVDPHRARRALQPRRRQREAGEEYEVALDFFHRALQNNPSEDIKQGVVAAMQRIQEKTGKAPEPLPAARILTRNAARDPGWRGVITCCHSMDAPALRRRVLQPQASPPCPIPRTSTSSSSAPAPAATWPRSAPRSSACKTAVVEKDELGGTCLNWGCIPTKAWIVTAHLLEQIKRAKEFGIEVGEPTDPLGLAARAQEQGGEAAHRRREDAAQGPPGRDLPRHRAARLGPNRIAVALDGRRRRSS